MHWALILAAWCVVTASVPQVRTIAGSWSLKAEAVKGHTEGGATWSRSAITGTLVIEQKDALLKGTWTGPKGDPWPFTGRVERDRFEFTTSAREMPVTKNGRATTAPFRWTFRGTVAGDTLRGTMALERDAESSDRLQPFIATRK